jgi:uncharacterized protein (TIGR03643 family)
MKPTDIAPQRPHARSPALPHTLSDAEVSGVVAMAWQDDTPFEAIALQFGLTEAEVVALMRAALKTRSFRLWRMRVRGRATKHQSQLRHDERVRIQQASGAALDQALFDAAQETFPLPPSALTRQSLC